MAHLQCISAVKNRSRMPIAKSLSAIANQDFAIPPKKQKKDNKLYDIEIVDEDGPNLKVHYVGYDEMYDEWKPRSQILIKKPEGDRTGYSPFAELVSCIKKKLKAIHTDDPAVRIQVGLNTYTCNIILHTIVIFAYYRYHATARVSLCWRKGENVQRMLVEESQRTP